MNVQNMNVTTTGGAMDIQKTSILITGQECVERQHMKTLAHQVNRN